MIKELSRAEMHELLSHERVARLGCIVDGFPYVVPVNYIFDGESVYIHSLPGQKVTAMRGNPRVCLQVDRVENELSWRSVLAIGLYEEITVAQTRSSLMSRILSRFPQLTPVESVIADDAGTPDPIVFRIRIEKLTGLREGQ